MYADMSRKTSLHIFDWLEGTLTLNATILKIVKRIAFLLDLFLRGCDGIRVGLMSATMLRQVVRA